MKRPVLTLSLALVACAVKSEAPLGTSSSSEGASATVLGQTAAERAAVGEETHQASPLL